MRTHHLAIAVALTALTARTAAADDPAPEAPATAATDDAAAVEQAHAEHHKAKKKAKDAEKKKTGDTIEVGGRVFARATASSEESAAWQSELGLASARVAVDYQWRERLRAAVEYEAAKKAVRDAFVQLELGHGLRVRAGRFKLPLGTVEQTSSWTLPTIDRGMVADILSDGLAATGRRSAVSVRWRGDAASKPTLEVAVAQTTQIGGGDLAALVKDGGGLTVAARAQISPCPMYTLAVAASSRNVAFLSTVDRFWTASAELELDLADAGYGLRLWGDAVVGSSPLTRATTGEDATFATGHVIAGYRLGGADRSAAYVEPYLGAGWFNPTLDHKRDDVTEVVVGVAGGLWKRWRVQSQLAYQNAKSARPIALLGITDVNDKLTVTTQLGAAF